MKLQTRRPKRLGWSMRSRVCEKRTWCYENFIIEIRERQAKGCRWSITSREHRLIKTTIPILFIHLYPDMSHYMFLATRFPSRH